MRHIKKIISTITALALILSMHSGCGMFTNYKAIAEQALEDKYGEEFICYSTWDEGGNDYFAKLAPAYDEGMKFMAAIDTKDKSCYYDKYIEAVVGQQVADIVYQEMDEIWSEYYVRVAINGQGLEIADTNHLSIESYYSAISDYSRSDQPFVKIVINGDKITNQQYNNEYKALLSIIERIPADDVSFDLFFVNNNLYTEYRTWFYDNYAINTGDFQYRTDYDDEIIFTVNKSSNTISLSEDKYTEIRKEK